MRKPFKFHVEGCGAEGATFETSGSFVCEFQECWDAVMIETFNQLTHGRAVFGSPGVGCRGPYDIRRVVIEQVPQ